MDFTRIKLWGGPNADNVSLNKIWPKSFNYELYVYLPISSLYIIPFDKNEQCILRQCLVKIIWSWLREIAHDTSYGPDQANIGDH